MHPNEILVTVQNLKVYFPIRETGFFGRSKGHVKAVDNVSFSIYQGETLALVGESGSGKTTVGRTILRTFEPTAGTVKFFLDSAEIDVTSLRGSSLRRFRRHMQMIFQDPYSSLNPRMTVRDIIAEPLVANGLASGATLNELVEAIALRCKLSPEHLPRYPHAFSGGQRQRIGIARALISNPVFVACDEAVSALDVSIQAEILNLLMDLQQELGVAYLFIAHDLSVVAQIAHRVAVMYVGEIVELASTEAVFRSPRHPYTAALLSAIPESNPDKVSSPILLTGEIPNPANPPPGCRFHTRCPFAQVLCQHTPPEWQEIEPNHFVACHFAHELTLKGV